MNNLAAVDDNTQKIINAGALQHYIKLLSTEYSESIQELAARGLFTMSVKCKHSVSKQPTCLNGWYIATLYCYSIVATVFIVFCCLNTFTLRCFCNM